MEPLVIPERPRQPVTSEKNSHDFVFPMKKGKRRKDKECC